MPAKPLSEGGKRTAFELPGLSEDTRVVRYICTGRKTHNVVQLALCSWAPDGRGFIIHMTHGTDSNPTAQAPDGAEVRFLLDRKCPKCQRHYQWREEKLEKITKAAGDGWAVVDFDLSMVR